MNARALALPLQAGCYLAGRTIGALLRRIAR